MLPNQVESESKDKNREDEVIWRSGLCALALDA
jgi:hypothetical protein